jgi:PAS domain S-box-containing protein
MDRLKSVIDNTNIQPGICTLSIESSLSGIIITDFQQPDNPIIYCNRAFEQLTGYSGEEVVGQNCRFLQGRDWDQRGRLKLKKAIESKQEAHVEIVNYRKDGTLFWNELYIAPIWSNTGAITHYIGIQNDITERKLKGIFLKLKGLQTDKITLLKDEFIGSASHELRTPLTTLKTSLQLLDQLLDDEDDEKKQGLLHKANNGVNRLIHLIELFLNTIKLESGKLLHQYSTFKAKDAVKKAIAELGFSVAHIKLSGNDALTVTADKERIEQVAVNILNNAVKFSGRDSLIHINIQRIGTNVKFTFRDQGIGILPDNLPYIFDRYYKGVDSQLNMSGLGLGLFISKEIIKSHGGDIGVESQRDVGSTFWFTLPVSK